MKIVNLEAMIADVESNMDYICCNCNEFIEDHWLIAHEDYTGQLLVVCPVMPVNLDHRFRPVINANFEELGRKLRLLYDTTGQTGHNVALIKKPSGIKIP